MSYRTVFVLEGRDIVVDDDYSVHADEALEAAFRVLYRKHGTGSGAAFAYVSEDGDPIIFGRAPHADFAAEFDEFKAGRIAWDLAGGHDTEEHKAEAEANSFDELWLNDPSMA